MEVKKKNIKKEDDDIQIEDNTERVKSQADQLKEWTKIYPIYLDSAIKKSEGRKLGSQYCVENPTIKELYVILKSMNLEVVAEDVKFLFKKFCKETSSKRLDEKRKINCKIKER